ncbi:MAG TPA: HIT family protein [Candidatus Bathyarchaeia archaeon]|jgi:histidine triad (HIT) family protein|nr:HIT family protein [Candidatus Bathyarchaeia archaeon]
MSEDCIFCRIVSRKAKAVIVYEDAHSLAFLDIHPLNPGHTLVIPKKHYPSMVEMPPEEVGKVFVSVSKVMRGVRKASNADGINIGQSNGRAASQEVFHMHAHIIPRYIHELPEGFPERKTATEAELEQVGKKIKAAIEK